MPKKDGRETLLLSTVVKSTGPATTEVQYFELGFLSLCLKQVTG